MGTFQLDDADESRLQIVIITGVAQVQGVGLQRERERGDRLGGPREQEEAERAKHFFMVPGR